MRLKRSIELNSATRKLGYNKRQLADLLGVDVSLISLQDQAESSVVDSRLRDTLVILDRCQPWTSSTEQALTRYRTQPIPSWGHPTAEDLVKADRGSGVLNYWARMGEGGYA